MKVVPVKPTDGGREVYAIKLDDGSFFGQEWVQGPAYNARSYPSWNTREAAQTKINKLKIEKKLKETN